MGVEPKIGVVKRSPPKWMVYKIMVPNPIKMDDLGVNPTPYFEKHPDGGYTGL